MFEITQYGILPPGIHKMNVEEVGKLFGGIPNLPYRLRLFEILKKYVQRLQALSIGIALIVDGSFVMTCVEKPADIDLVLVMPEKWEKPIEKIPQEQYNLPSSVEVEAEFAVRLSPKIDQQEKSGKKPHSIGMHLSVEKRTHQSSCILLGMQV